MLTRGGFELLLEPVFWPFDELLLVVFVEFDWLDALFGAFKFEKIELTF